MALETMLLIGGALILAMVFLMVFGLIGLGAIVLVGIAGLGMTVYGFVEGGLDGLGLEIAAGTLQILPLLGL